MAQGFKRYAKGGRFKPNDIADGGLSEYRRQQREIIDALKLQQARTDEYRKEFSRESEGVSKREAQNTELLQDLENRAWETRRRAVEVRGKREVEALEGKAKEYEKESKFWMDFAPKFSKGLAQTAVGIKTYIDNKKADENLTTAIANGNFTILHENLDKQFNKEGVKLSKLKQEAYKTGDTDAIDWITGVEKNDYATQIKFSNHIEKNIDSFSSEVKDIVAQDPDLAWNSKYIEGYYLVRAKEFIKRFNLQGKAANTVVRAFSRAGIAAKMEAQRTEIGQKQQTNRNNYLRTVVLGKGTVENPTNMQNFINSFRHGYKVQGNSYVPIISTDVNAAAIEAMKALASTGKYTFDEAWTLISNTNIPDQPGPVQTTFAQHEATKKVSTLRLESEQAFADGAAIATQRSNNLRNYKDTVELTKNPILFAADGEIGSLENTNEFYEKTIDRYETLVKEGNTKAATEISDKYWFINPDTINEQDKILNLIREVNIGDARGALYSYRQLSETARKLVPKELIEGVEVLNKMFPDESGQVSQSRSGTKVLKSFIESELLINMKRITKKNALGLDQTIIKQSIEDISPYVQAMYTSKMLELMPRYKTETGYDIAGLKSAMQDQLKKMLVSDTGILERIDLATERGISNMNNSVVSDGIGRYYMLSGNQITTKVIPDRDIARVIQEELKVPGKAVIKTIKNGTTIYTLDENLLRTIHPGELRTSAVDIVTGRLEGKTITIPRAIHVIYHQLGGAYTKTEILNMALKQNGYTEQVLDGQHEILKTKKLNFWSKGDDDTLGGPSSVITQPNRKFNFKDVRPEDAVPSNIFLDAYSQSGTKPVSLANRPYTFENINGGDIFTEQLKLVSGETTDFNELVVDWDDKGSYMDFVGTKLKGVEDKKLEYSKEYFLFFVKNRHKLGVEIIPLDNGGFRFRTKPPALTTPRSSVPRGENVSGTDYTNPRDENQSQGPLPERTLPKITRDDNTPQADWFSWVTGRQSTADYNAGMEMIRKRNRRTK